MAIRIDGTNTTANPGITGADADTGLQFGTDEVQFVTGGTNRATVESNGNLTIEDGNLVVAAGHGIDFSGTADGSGTTTSELLDDYEEGTWTPTFIGATTAGSYTSTNDAWYTKVGNTVTVYAELQNITDVSLGSGGLNISGLPYTNGSSNALGSVIFVSFNLDDTTVNLTAYVGAGDSVVKFFETRDNTSSSGVNVLDRVVDTADLYLQVTYKVN